MTAQADTEARTASAAVREDAADHRPPLTAYIRTLNEARMIDAVVRSALRVAREVVVVDSGSTDGTQEIARAAGARVEERGWVGVGRQKRLGESLAKNDWLLDLDADEVVSEELAGEIARLLAANPAPDRVFRIKLITVPPIGRPWYTVRIQWREKLYNRTVNRMPDSKAWDQLEFPPETEITVLKGALMHHAFTGIAHLVTKLNRNTEARAVEALKPLPITVLRVFFAMPVYFLKEYVMRRMMFAGIYGFAFSVTIAFGRWLRDVKMFEIHMRDRRG